MKAYDKARKLATDAEILAGVEQYKKSKPAYADYCHPATWLNQGRWMDEPDTAQRTRRGEDVLLMESTLDHDAIARECQRLHGGTCNGSHGHLRRMQLEAARKSAAS